MPASDQRSILARKIAVHAGVGQSRDDLVSALGAGLTRAVRRAAAPLDGFAVRLENVEIGLQATLDTALDGLPDHGLIAATEDRDGRRGLLALEHSLIDALIEVQTTGRVEEVQGPPRSVTRIDEALCRDFIDLFFAAFAHETAGISGRDWPERIAYGSQIKDRTQINLLLPSRGYHLLQVRVTAAGLKTGKLLILVPTDAALARRNVQKQQAKPARPESWRDDMLAALGAAPLALDAVLMRLFMPLSKVENLAEGDLVPFDRNDLSAVTLEGEGGFVLARGKLGQISGKRAVRIGPARKTSGASGGEAVPAPAPAPTSRQSVQNAAAGSIPAALDTTGLGSEASGGDANGSDQPVADMGAPLPELPMAGFDPDAPIG